MERSAPCFDRRVVPDEVLTVVRGFQERAPCELGGGAALAGVYLGHRLSRDVDLFFADPASLRQAVADAGLVAHGAGARIAVKRDGGTFVRAQLAAGPHTLDLDLVHEPLALETGPRVEGISVRSLPDLRASKLTCLLSRSEPRDLVDILFLERAGFDPEGALPLALRKDAGIDPAVLAWLLGQFPVEPLPLMLVPLTVAELAAYRGSLRERLRRCALPPS